MIKKIIFACWVFTMALCGQEQPQLVLFFDINKTLIASDKATNKSTDNVLNELLAEKYEACWDRLITTPLSFENYVNTFLVPGPKENQLLKLQRKYYIHHFLEILHRLDHPLYPTVFQEYEMLLSKLNDAPTSIFSSFFTLIDYLEQHNLSYSIVLRSFGDDVHEISDQINSVYQEFFSGKAFFKQGHLYLEGKASINDPLAIYQELKQVENCVIRDDWNFWMAGGMTAKQGKPFYVNREDNDTLFIFFDDNIDEHDSHKNIVATIDALTGELLPIEEFVESGQIVRVDTLQAIKCDKYYIDLVENAIKNFKRKP